MRVAVRGRPDAGTAIVRLRIGTQSIGMFTVPPLATNVPRALVSTSFVAATTGTQTPEVALVPSSAAFDATELVLLPESAVNTFDMRQQRLGVGILTPGATQLQATALKAGRAHARQLHRGRGRGERDAHTPVGT